MGRPPLENARQEPRRGRSPRVAEGTVLSFCEQVQGCNRKSTSNHTHGAPEIEKLINVALYAYQSILGRNLWKLWFLNNSESNDNQEPDSEDFKSFGKSEVADLPLGKDFFAMALVFFDRAMKCVEPSLAIPTTTVMGLLREEQMKMAREVVEEAKAPLKGVWDWLKTSDLKAIAEKTTKKLQARAEGLVVTREEIKKLMDEELAALFQEKAKNNK